MQSPQPLTNDENIFKMSLHFFILGFYLAG